MNEEQMLVLRGPFPLDVHSFKPGATTKDKTRALGLAYVDSRQYQARLDKVDPAWTVAYSANFVEGRILVNCRLTVLGVTREDVGECAFSDKNAYTSAVAQAFKRTCSQFGLGRYLYDMPQVWADYNQQRKRFTDKGVGALKQALAAACGAKNRMPSGNGGGTAAKATKQKAEPAPPSAPAQGNRNGRKGENITVPAVTGKTTSRARAISLTFGTYKGETMGKVFDEDRKYIQRLADGKITDKASTQAIRAAAMYMMQLPAPSNGHGQSKAKSNGTLSSDEALAVTMPFGTRNHPEYRNKSLREIEAVESKLVTWLAENAKADHLKKAASVVIKSRSQ